MDHMAKEHTFTQALQTTKITSWIDRGGDVNSTAFSRLGHTLLQMAVIDNHDNLVGELLHRGADADSRGRGGKTSLMIAAKFGHAKCVEHLLRAGARADLRAAEDDTDFTEHDGLTALEIVAAETSTKGVKPRFSDITRMLSEAERLQQARRARPSSE